LITKPRVFLAMPFGEKPGADGRLIDFDAVHDALLTPALEERFDVFRADDEMMSGSIHADMFEELLLADLCVVDITVDNPNVWYELGVRHTLRRRGTVLIKGLPDRHVPFDVAGFRTITYTLADAAPRRPAAVNSQADRALIRDAVTATHESWRKRSDSPVYDFLPDLKEPDWRELRSPQIAEKRDQLRDFEERVRVALAAKRPGSILLLADELPNRAVRVEALRSAGKALNRLGAYEAARQTFERALTIDPDDVVCRQQQAIALGRTGQRELAQQALVRLNEDDPGNGETLGLLARTHKDAWTASFRPKDSRPSDDLRAGALASEGMLLNAVRHYAAAFRAEPDNYFPGINAVSLGTIWESLTGGEIAREERDCDLARMAAGVDWGTDCAIARNRNDCWALATRGELALVRGEPEDVVLRAYNRAAQSDSAGWFEIDSMLQQVVMFRQLGLRPELCDRLIGTLKQQLAAKAVPAGEGKTFLFAGHMVDRADRPAPRFPASKVDAARAAIRRALADAGAQPGDLAISGAACGGDLLFLEACLERFGMDAELHQPMTDAEFIGESVSFAGRQWEELYRRLSRHDKVTKLVLPDELGPTPNGMSVHARNTLWLVYSAISHRADRLHAILLWDGGGGDGPGGTRHMADELERLTGRKPTVIDPATL